MRSFEELAKAYQFSPVRGTDGELAGYLHLDAVATKATLNSKGFHHFDGDDNGWFDLEIEDRHGSRVLLHNALTQSQSMPGSIHGKPAGSYTSEIFPNIVVVGAGNLRKDRTLHQMAFQFEGAENFFVYDTIEWLSFHGQPGRKAALKTLRREAWKPPRELRGRNYSYNPDEVYVIHHAKSYLDVALEDMKIRVWHARSQRGLGWTGHEIKITPIVSVIFDAPVSVDEAISRLWRIKGFFDQLALRDLRVRAISFSKYKKGWPAADVYLPNEAKKAETARLDVHPLYVPFSRWAERKKFAACLLRWLEHSEKRRFFRLAVRLSLVRLQSEIDPTLVTLLMAGVESLAELGGKSGISPGTIAKMAHAAHAVDAAVDYSSLRGLLGVLGRKSPKERLRIMAERSLGEDGNEIEAFASASVRVRNQIAHGRSMDEFERLAAGDLAQALTYLCVTYDLQTAGFPSKEDDREHRSLLAGSRMGWAWQGFKLASERSLDSDE